MVHIFDILLSIQRVPVSIPTTATNFRNKIIKNTYQYNVGRRVNPEMLCINIKYVSHSGQHPIQL
jgi:hypothetical protein